ncbi:S8 family serine peptidase [uncultured Microscilla sp.]|uniref:S8 family serine peptidase n=1 Tax=uncultured Microscilla sp. TaxID=432653 RepID=UPI0026135E5A|nr:S8 family serine peptidase [uncultured Microscilla sp.]
MKILLQKIQLLTLTLTLSMATFAQKRFETIKVAPGCLSYTNTIQVKILNFKAFDQWCTQYLPQNKIKQLYPNIAQVSNACHQTIAKLAACPQVLFIDRGKLSAKTELSFDSRGIWLNKISAVHQLYPQLNGDGLFVSVREDPFNITDIDFAGRIADTTNLGKTVDTHASIIASVIAGGGNSSSGALGVAWKAQLYSSGFRNGLAPDNGNTLMKQKAYVQNHSYGVGAIENYYGIEAEAYDQHGIDFPQLLHVFSIGNFGNQADATAHTKYNIKGFANLSGQFKVAKNVLTVGEIDTNSVVTTLSSRGPAYDGRVKPELVAYGGGNGSSESAAIVSGIGLLAQQAYQRKKGQTPPAALLKAVLINAADDLGRTGVDFEYGFGSVDALGTIKTLEDNRYATEILAATNDHKTFKITVPTNAQHLKVTLVWHDPAAKAGNTKALVNDLDLSVKKVGTGTIWKPWTLNTFAHADSLKLPAQRGEDHLNNIEQVMLSFPEAGTYEINVKAFSLAVSNQRFSIAYEYPTGFEWVYPLQNNVLQAARTSRLQWNWHKVAEPGKLEYKLANSNTWQLIAHLNDLSKEYHHWAVPNLFAPIQIRLTAQSGFSFTSDPFQVMAGFAPNVGYNCPQAIMLFWPPLPGVSSYQVYKMGEKYLEPIAQVQDTLVVINKSTHSSKYFAVAPFIDNTAIRWGNTINIDFKGIKCYFKSFLATPGFNDTTRLQLALATDYHLSNIALQRSNRSGEGFKTIANTLPNGALYTFSDASPLAYRNVYRVALTNAPGNTFYSDEVEVLVVAQNEFFMYPNPTRLNQPLVVTDRRNEIEKVRILNLAGKVLQQYVPNGSDQKELFTDGLATGVYLVEFMLKDGSRKTKRLVIK